MQTLKRGILVGLLISLFSLPFVAFWQRQALFDYFRLRNYSPGPEIVALADATTMNEKARRLFYVYHPELQDQKSFNQNCKSSEHSIVLGCYVEGTGIYIYDVEDPRLKGIEEVTAAHEMLHAAYERLSGSERKRIDELTHSTFELLDNPRVRKAITSYQKNNPEVVPNELHSIIGTEVRDIPEELEEYYARYFDNRKNIVALSEQYEKAFTERQNKIEAYDRQLADIRMEIESSEDTLNQLQARLTSEKARLDRLLNSGQASEYNAAVPSYNETVGSYNSLADRIKGLIDKYNRIVSDRNELVLEEQELVDAIDSRPTTIKTEE